MLSKAVGAALFLVRFEPMHTVVQFRASPGENNDHHEQARDGNANATRPKRVWEDLRCVDVGAGIDCPTIEPNVKEKKEHGRFGTSG